MATHKPFRSDPSADIQQQRQSFEAQLGAQTGDALLDVWERYIRWAWQVFPEGGKGSTVNKLLERAVIEFANQHKYNNDPRYVSIWIQLAQQSESPGEMFSYMQAEGIGLARADFYLSWAKYRQSQGEHQMALRLIQQGLSTNAQPAEQLLHCQRVLQGRQSVSAPAQEEMAAPDVPPPSSVSRRRVRRDLNTSASHEHTGSRSVSPGRTFTARDGDATRRATAPEPLDLPQPGKLAKTANTLAVPTSLPRHHPQMSSGGSSEMEEQLSVPFTVYEDMRPESPYTQPAGSLEEAGLEERGADTERPMYYREQLRGAAGAEFSFEELRAQRYFDAQKRQMEERLAQVEQEKKHLKEMLLRRSQQEVSAGPPAPLPLPQSFPERMESLSEEMTNSYQNKTMFSIPDNTCDFAAAAKMASTPCSRAAGQRPARTPQPTAFQGGLTESRPPLQPCSVPDGGGGAQLSPILETSREGWSSSASSSGPASSLSSTTIAPPTTRVEEDEEEGPDHAHSTAVDPCSVDARKCILDQSDITSSPCFHSENAAMPQIQDGRISLGSHSFYVPVKLCDSGSATVYLACTDNRDVSDCNMLLKVDSCAVPWDFYMASRLRDRQSGDPQAPPLPDVGCFLFQDGCVTVYKLPPQHTLEHESVYQGGEEHDCVPPLLKLTRSLHASHLLQGQPHTHMHFCVNRATQSVDCLLPVDLASSLDLLSQQEVTSAQQVPYALPYIAKGLIQPSDSPYQVDLVIMAETINTLLTRKRQMDLIQDQRGWTVAGLDPYDPRSGMWDKMFRLLLNPDRQKTSVAVLSETLDLMASAGIEV